MRRNWRGEQKITADYLRMYTAYEGKIHVDYNELFVCDSHASCRITAQNELDDLQAFQRARQSATVPAPSPLRTVPWAQA